ncbi:GNAT family N-acetyltransferase [Gracilibacillus thailandensis]|uniref:GNAT family N-acetyltransferase n=1 Tax=Gracilibacillus thailandensis TaxID=563735 RepID=A0A6N7QUD4_9BACI|nr:GNAT family N-acetyltransferase [Gracilibacillus thailandensis]MRI65628.1 GNAT family N-acetyltransferase [Gracilibacillus thailandensis]
MTLTIRNMEYGDIKQVQIIARTSWFATYQGIIPTEIQKKFLASAYSEEMMKKRLENSILLVAEMEEQLVGFANFSTVKNNGEVELHAIYLMPAYQGKGIGTSLLDKGIQKLQAVKEIYVDVEKENSIGRHFYDAKGFQEVEEFDDNFDGHILKTIRMVLLL